ncbi:zf-HC2 domain-containing protein [Streptomyces sp. NPDC047108]|uniref:anti-sigma factor family protein n=1 Tax=Streptomyces sp. NPDC047108 TaxID=3155025 RepID=UPI0033FE5158
MIPAPEHDPEHLGSLVAHACGALDDEDGRALEEHLSTCASCSFELVELHGLRELLDLVPSDLVRAAGPPPPVSEPLVRRTIRAARGKRATRPSPGTARLAAAGAVTALALCGGIVIGQSIEPHAGPSETIGSAAEKATGADVSTSSVRGAAGVDARTGTRIVVKVTAAGDRVRLGASVTGVPAGVMCRLVVVGWHGARETAASWRASASGEKDVGEIDGRASMNPDEIKAVEVRTADGRRLVSVPVPA